MVSFGSLITFEAAPVGKGSLRVDVRSSSRVGLVDGAGQLPALYNYIGKSVILPMHYYTHTTVDWLFIGQQACVMITLDIIRDIIRACVPMRVYGYKTLS